MLRFTDSFNHYTSADIAKKWTSVSNAGSASGTQITSGGRHGNAMRFQQAGSATKSLDNQSTWTVGFAMTVNGLPSGDQQIIQFLDTGTNQVDLRFLSTGLLRVTRNGTTLGTSAASLTPNTYYHIAMKAVINNTTGSYEVRVNDVNVLSATGVNTRNTANNFANMIRIMAASGFSGVYLVDDLYICDGQGSTNNTFLGDVAIGCQFADGNGDLSEWTPSAGSNYECVDDSTPNDDTDYVSSSTVGNRDLYTFEDVAGPAVSILGVQRCLYAAKDDAGTRTLKPIVKSGGTVYEGSGVNLASNYLYYTDILETDPATSAAWTLANMNAAQFGTKLEA